MNIQNPLTHDPQTPLRLSRVLLCLEVVSKRFGDLNILKRDRAGKRVFLEYQKRASILLKKGIGDIKDISNFEKSFSGEDELGVAISETQSLPRAEEVRLRIGRLSYQIGSGRRKEIQSLMDDLSLVVYNIIYRLFRDIDAKLLEIESQVPEMMNDFARHEKSNTFDAMSTGLDEMQKISAQTREYIDTLLQFSDKLIKAQEIYNDKNYSIGKTLNSVTIPRYIKKIEYRIGELRDVSSQYANSHAVLSGKKYEKERKSKQRKDYRLYTEAQNAYRELLLPNPHTPKERQDLIEILNRFLTMTDFVISNIEEEHPDIKNGEGFNKSNVREFLDRLLKDPEIEEPNPTPIVTPRVNTQVNAPFYSGRITPMLGDDRFEE